MNTIPRWRKASASANTDNCVEVDVSSLAAVRDTKHPTSMLHVDLRGLLTAVRDGRFDR